MTDLLTEPNEDALTRICEAHWNRRGGDGVTFFDIHQHDACNHTLRGHIEIDGHTYGFLIDNGNWDGTVVREWVTDTEDLGGYEPPRPTLYTYVPQKARADMFAGMLGVYKYWTEQAWFKEKVQAYNYDRHFAPGGKTEKYYADWAATKGMRIAPEEEAAVYLAPVEDAEAHNAERDRIIEDIKTLTAMMEGHVTDG